MIVRQWKTTFDESRKTELVAYANEVSLPTLSTRPGCVGVAFLSSGNRWITQTIWRNQASIDALAEDKDYDRIVDGIQHGTVMIANNLTGGCYQR